MTATLRTLHASISVKGLSVFVEVVAAPPASTTTQHKSGGLPKMA